MTRTKGCISWSGQLLTELDAGGTAVVVVRSDSEEDIRDVVETYIHQDYQPPPPAAPGTYDPAPRGRVADRGLVMREVTAFGTLKAAGFYGVFSLGDLPQQAAAPGQPSSTPASPASAGRATLLGFLAEALSPASSFGSAPRLLYIPSPAYLGISPVGGSASAHVDAYHQQAVYLLRQLAIAKRQGRTRVLVVVGAAPEETLPGLMEEAYLLDVPYPDDAEVRALIEEVYAAEAEPPVVPIAEFIMVRLCELFRGFRRAQIRTTLSTAFARYPNPLQNGAAELIADIRAAKLQHLKTASGLTWLEPGDEDPGGLGELVDWVARKRTVLAYADAARRHAVGLPQGVLAFGPPGTGKTLAAKWTARSLGLPLFSLEVGSIMGRYQGESEQRFERTLKLAEAMAPCVLLIDELDKNFAGVGTGGENNASLDRIFGRLLVWLQESERRRAPVMVFATANHVDRIPDELMRLGRFDEKFFLFVPTARELARILELQVERHACMIEGGAAEAGCAAPDLADRVRAEVLPVVLRCAIEQGRYPTGSDLATVVKETFQELFTQCMEGLPSDRARRAAAAASAPVLRVPLVGGEGVSGVADVLVRKLTEARTYFDTACDDVLWYWRWAERNRPRAASADEPLLGFSGFDRRAGRFDALPGLGLGELAGLDDAAYRTALARRAAEVRSVPDGATVEELERRYDEAFSCELALALSEWARGW